MSVAGAVSVTRRSPITIRVTEFDPHAALNEWRLWIGHTASGTPPANPAALAGSPGLYYVAQPAPGQQVLLTYPGNAFAALAYWTSLAPGDIPGLTTAKYLWVGITEDDVTSSEWLVLSSALRPRP